MNKNDLKDLVDQVYALWNQSVPVASAKITYEAWMAMLGDLDHKECQEAVTTLAALDSYMPRPGAIRRKVIDLRGTETPPSAIEAWTQLRRIMETVNAGTYSPEPMHEAVSEAARRIGTNLHTNGDREQFIKMYDSITQKWEETLYTPPKEQS